MKNKIFLTSMLAVLVACPAFAEYGVNPAPDSSGYITFGTNDTGDSVDAPCTADLLTYQGSGHSSGTFTFTAGWTPKVYSVTYAAGTCGGTPVSPESRTYNVAYTTLEIGDESGQSGVTVPTGYTFGGWTETVNGTPTGETRNDPYTYAAESVAGDITLTANCSASTYNVRYDCNGGSFTTAYSSGGINYSDWDDTTNHSQQVTYNGSYNFLTPSAVCEKNGASASAWNCYIDTTPLDTSATVSATNTNSWSTANDVVCLADWSPNSIGLQWNKAGGEWAMDANEQPLSNQPSCDYGADAGETGGINDVYKPTREGYEFTGWYITGWSE